ncbi:MAG: hypothetical protein J6P83_05535 [Bacteroidales bacterium]|nr:hypothetical protein [Bacteroidales bacterium]
MSKATLTSLLEFLYGLLSSEDKRWIGEQLIQQANTEEMKPYTIEELHQMVAEGERQFAEGKWQDSEDMFRELEEEVASEELKYSEAV